ncbi:MAG: spermidine synthase, partial [Armatimonadetes bacterium]|nr:spermidine synthase [Armatimonadota bacterium]
MALLFTCTTFLASLLLFSVQPLVARLILPSLGGSPAVWNTSMVFFQAVLLGGYLYAHGVGTRLNSARRGVLVLHGLLLLLPLAFLPLALPRDAAPPATAQPILWLLGLLLLCVGAPFFVLSSSSPLLQRLFALTTHRD